ncbi:MAG: ribosome biogenesis/translation initiation ATPase RLI [Candidatus Woesearchaeota archaeon]
MPRLAILDKEKCVIDSKCPFQCRKFCPEVRMGNEAVVRDEEDDKPIIVEDLCTGCGICVKRCPVDCIDIINLPEELNKTAIHRFGKNGFKLFNLPSPKKGSIVGIIGRNGIGKSTSVKILSGMIQPNFEKEDIDKKESVKKLLDKYKGKEQQNFFEELSKGNIEVSYKPQQVEKIPKMSKGKAIDLLENISDDEKKIEEVLDELGLEEVIDRDINVLSGGELQKVAIAATFLKDSDIYLLDEPTSYLDLNGRVNIARFMRNFIQKNPEKSIMVIEHDLITLDFLSDYIQVVYGKPSAYGIFSQLKSTNVGINEYLSGMLSNENTRIRKKEIKYGSKTHNKALNTEPLIEWKDLKIKLGDFLLNSEKGNINKNKITGFVGKNGIGKTTLMKALAGEIDIDSGEIKGDQVDISYKPQYIKRNDQMVSFVLRNATQKSIKQFNVEHLMDKTLEELSGGELQKVAILKTISKDADIYLFDEPSTFLDVEERLRLYRIIRSLIYDKDKTSVIIDHDLLFIDYISDEITVFSGESGKEGHINGPYLINKGMNMFLKRLDITMRRDFHSKRPRINKLDSQLDKKQRENNNWYGR